MTDARVNWSNMLLRKVANLNNIYNAEITLVMFMNLLHIFFIYNKYLTCSVKKKMV